MMFEQGELILYESADGQATIDVRLQDETVWLSQSQMIELFGRDQSVISRHINNVFKEGELVRESNMQKMHIANSDKPVAFYNLDIIISVGYRVKSKQGTQFRIWATQLLRDHLVQGFTLNQKRLAEKGMAEVQQVVGLLADTLQSHELVGDEGKAILDLVRHYTKTWNLLIQYDEDRLLLPKSSSVAQPLGISAAREAITTLKADLIQRDEATELFGQERGHGLDGVLGAVSQTFGGQDLYPGVARKAANLLYFIIKDHPFSDGNKRIGAFLFLLFLRFNKIECERCFSNNALVALTLLTATSDPSQKDIIVRLIVNLIKRG